LATFEQDGEKLTGNFSGAQGRIEELSGSMVGDQISFTVKFQGRRGEITLSFKGTVEGDSMKGSVESGRNSMEWMAKKKGA
jgi:hypothetical protein